jgi:protein phosphatase
VIPVTPAAKAAALSRQVNRPDALDVDETDSLRLAEEGPPTVGRHWFRGTFLVVLVVAVLTGGGYAAYQWSQRQYFVGQAQGHVAIYQGISQNIGSWNLATMIDQTDVALVDLPGFYRNKVDSTVTTASIEDARRLVTDLRMQAVQCQITKAAGGTCGSSIQ